METSPMEQTYEDSSGMPLDYTDDFLLDLWGLSSGGIEDRTPHILHTYVYPVILLVAVFGNVITCLIMFKMSFKVVSTCAHLSLLSVVDLLLLFITCGSDWLQKPLGYELTYRLRHTSDVYCRTSVFIENFLCHLSKWLLVVMAIDGVMLTLMVRNSIKWVTMFRARTTILLLMLALCLLNIHYFWTYMMMVSKEEGTTKTHCGFVMFGIAYNKEFQVTIWPLLDLTVTDILPLMIVGVCTLIMTVRLCKTAPADMQGGRVPKSSHPNNTRELRDLKVTFCVLGILFFIFTLPVFAWKVCTEYSYNKIFPKQYDTGIQENYHNENQQDLSIKEMEFNKAWLKSIKDGFFKACVCTVWYIFLGSKIFIYLSTSAKFRQEFQALFCCHWCQKTCQRAKTAEKLEKLKQKQEKLRFEDRLESMTAECHNLVDTTEQSDNTDFCSSHAKKHTIV